MDSYLRSSGSDHPDEELVQGRRGVVRLFPQSAKRRPRMNQQSHRQPLSALLSRAWSALAELAFSDSRSEGATTS